MRARLLAVSAVAALSAAALPAHAATKSVQLFFDNAGSCGTDSPVPALVTGGPAGSECNPARVGAQGKGSLGSESYLNSGKKTVGYKVDARRKLVGKLNLVCTGPISTTGNVPGYVGAEVTIAINGVTVGTASGAGPITAPGGSYGIPISMAVPKSLNLKVVKSVMATVKYTAGTGICGVAYTAPASSSFTIPSA